MKEFTALCTMMPPLDTPNGSKYVSFYAIYDSESDEHRKFAEATPSLSLQMNVKESFGKDLEPGKYILTFKKVED